MAACTIIYLSIFLFAAIAIVALFSQCIFFKNVASHLSEYCSQNVARGFPYFSLSMLMCIQDKPEE